MNGERRKGGDKRQKEFKQRREAGERASPGREGREWKRKTRLQVKEGCQGGGGKSSRKMKSGWWRDEKKEREREREREQGEGEKKKHRHWKEFSTDKESESRAALVSIAGRC